MRQSVVIVAGGSGSRMKSTIPKQFLLLKGRPILFYTLEAFFSFNAAVEIVLVLPENQISYWNQLIQEHKFSVPHQITAGGKTRYHSVAAGLNMIQGNGLVAIHDGVRCLVGKEVLSQVFLMAEEKGNATVAVASKDSLRRVGNDGNYAVNRSEYRIIQTPQVFAIDTLKKAFDKGYQEHFTDDASVFEHAGHTIHLSEGSYENIKITTPEDLLLAESILSRRT